MKLKIALLLFICFLPHLFAEQNELQQIRELFYLGVDDEEAAEKLDRMITRNYSKDISKYPPLILAYAGGVEALKAKHAFSPFAKFSHLLNSLEILEDAVKSMPGDLEVRFIRFSILDNVPSFLGYGEELNSDKSVVIKQLLKNDFRSINKDTQKGMVEYLIKSDNLSDEEKNMLTEKCLAMREQ